MSIVSLRRVTMDKQKGCYGHKEKHFLNAYSNHTIKFVHLKFIFLAWQMKSTNIIVVLELQEAIFCQIYIKI